MRQPAYYIILSVLFMILAMDVESQPIYSGESLRELFEGIMETKDNEERVRLNDSIIYIIDKYVESEGVLNHKFTDLRYLGQILSPDSKLKIITWNLVLTDGTNKYFCYIIRKVKRRDPNRVYKLTGVNMDEPPGADKTYSAEDWYGALYYDVRPFRHKRNTCYVLLGLDHTNLNISTKLIDVLTFTDDGRIIFGKDCFSREGERKYREILVYSADGVVTLRFNGRKSIIFNHLVPVSQFRQDTPGYYVPEFSFDRYYLKKGMWIFEENIEPKMRK
jgi:hypothetical protein